MNITEYTLPENLSSAIGSLFFDDQNQQIGVSFRGRDTKYMYNVNGDYDMAKDDLLIEMDGASVNKEKFSVGKYFNQMKSKNRLVEI
tara:strand:- start:1181 stop:1441 length:261 start_codon:yes stop_codon:yes gene_type:complete